MINQLKTGNNTEKETTRIEAFSDGVFAIAITLLILELIEFLHSSNEEGLLELLLNHWESFLAFVVGFFTILVCWINHHLVYNYIKKIDSNLVWVNGFVLLVVTFTPFPTAVLSQYLLKEPNLAVGVFGINYFLMSLVAYNITAYSYNKHLVDEDSLELYYRFKLLYRWVSVYTFVVLFLCFVSVTLALILYCLMFAFMAFPKETSRFFFSNKIDKGRNPQKRKKVKLRTRVSVK
ncbi:MAG TPA: TMEM175 family protein [Hanamia sp.]|nr:TMEM175 family protein [Hanamia sp.]